MHVDADERSTGFRRDVSAARPFPRGLALTLALALVLVARSGPPTSIRAQSPFPPREGAIANSTDMALSEARVQREFDERIGRPYGLDGLFLLVEECLPEPESYLDEALPHYDMAPEPGGLYDDALVWMVCESPRYVGFFYAADSAHGAAFDAEGLYDTVSLRMAEQLGAGNLTGALTVGIDLAARALDRVSADADPGAPPPGTAEADVAEAGEDAAGLGSSIEGSGAVRRAEEPKEDMIPAEDGGLARQIAGLAALGLGGLWAWRRRKREEAGAAEGDERKRKEAEVVAREGPRGPLTRRVEALSKRLVKESNALARLVLAYESIGPEAMLEVSHRHEEMLARLASLKATLEELPAIGPETPGAIERAADTELRERYAALAQEAETLEAYVDELEREADHVEMLEERAAVLAVEARKAISSASAAYAGLVERIEPGTVDLPAVAVAMSVPAELADRAEASLALDDRITAGRYAEDAATLAKHLPRVLEEALRIDDRIEEGVLLYDRIEAYVEQSWADIRGNGSEAEESLEAALEMFARLLAAEHAAFGADAAAGFMDGIEKVAGELVRAEALIQAIADRLERLDAARGSAVDTIDQLREEIRKTRAWLDRRDVEADVDEAPGLSIDRAEALLDETALAMTEDKPDWMNVSRNLQRVAQAVAKALAEAERQNEWVDALRASWEKARASAAAAVDRASTYQRAHRADLGPLGLKRMDDARGALHEAENLAREAERLEGTGRASAVQRAVEQATAAEDAAEAAYEVMAADVARADKRRGDYVPRPMWIGPTVPSPSRRRRSILFPDPFGAGAGPIVRPSRQGGWGSRPRPSTRPVQQRPVQRRPSSRPSSTRRGGGRGW